jgi:hypothetical protein
MVSADPYSDAYAPWTMRSLAWWRPQTFSSADEISPTVHRARAACRVWIGYCNDARANTLTASQTSGGGGGNET